MYDLKGNTILSFFSLGSKLAANTLVLIFLARYLSVTDYGLFAYAYTITTICIIIVDFGFNIQAVKYIADNPNETNTYIQSVFIVKAILSITMLGLIVLLDIAFSFDSKTREIVLLLSIGSIFNSYGIFIGTIFRAINRFKVDTLTSIFSSSVFFFVIIAACILGGNVFIIAFVYAISRILYFLLNSYLLSLSGLWMIKIPQFIYIMKILKGTFPFGLHAFFGALYFNADIILVKEYLSLSDVASYQAMTRIIMAMVFFAEVLSSAFYPLLARLDTNDIDGFARTKRIYYVASLLISVSLFLIIVFFAKQIILGLYGTKYISATIILQLLSVSIPMKFLGYLYGTLLSSVNLQLIRQNVSIIASVLIIILNVLFLSKYGLKAAAFSTITVNAFVLAAYIRYYSSFDNHRS